MANKFWYAVQMDKEDDWSTGSYDYDEAMAMLRKYIEKDGYLDALIAVIDEEHSVCVDELYL